MEYSAMVKTKDRGLRMIRKIDPDIEREICDMETSIRKARKTLSGISSFSNKIASHMEILGNAIRDIPGLEKTIHEKLEFPGPDSEIPESVKVCFHPEDTPPLPSPETESPSRSFEIEAKTGLPEPMFDTRNWDKIAEEFASFEEQFETAIELLRKADEKTMRAEDSENAKPPGRKHFADEKNTQKREFAGNKVISEQAKTR